MSFSCDAFAANANFTLELNGCKLRNWSGFLDTDSLSMHRIHSVWGEIRTITTNRASLSKRERKHNHVGFLVWNSIVLRIEARNIFGIRHRQWIYVHIWVNKVGFWGASCSKLSHIGAKCSSLVENINMEYSQSISKFRIHMCIECSIVWHCFLVLAFFRVCVCACSSSYVHCYALDLVNQTNVLIWLRNGILFISALIVASSTSGEINQWVHSEKKWCFFFIHKCVCSLHLVYVYATRTRSCALRSSHTLYPDARLPIPDPSLSLALTPRPSSHIHTCALAHFSNIHILFVAINFCSCKHITELEWG